MKQYEVKIQSSASGNMYTVIVYPDGVENKGEVFAHSDLYYKIDKKGRKIISRTYGEKFKTSRQCADEHIAQLEAEGYTRYVNPGIKDMARAVVELDKVGKKPDLPWK